jgi:hypothetical protein
MGCITFEKEPEMTTRNLPGGKGRPAREADSLTAVYEQTV